MKKSQEMKAANFRMNGLVLKSQIGLDCQAQEKSQNMLQNIKLVKKEE